MLGFAIRRIATLVPTLFVIITLSFLIIRLAPGGPFDEEQAPAAGDRANLERPTGSTSPLPRSTCATSRASPTGISGRPSSFGIRASAS